MGQTFEHLIERIQTEAIDQADAEAEKLIDQATRKAADIVREAEAKAAKLLSDAELEATRYTDQSARSLEQAARNLLMSIGEGVQTILTDLVEGAVDEAMDISLLRELISKAVDSYLAHEGRESRIRVLLNLEDKEKLIRFFQERYQDMIQHDLEFQVDEQVYKGFRVSYGDAHVYHDFTREAIAQALINYLRPHLSEVVERAAAQQHAEEPGSGRVNYYDIMSSMPTLNLGSPPPLSPEALIENCVGRMPSGDEAELLHFVEGSYTACKTPFALKWSTFEDTLRRKIAGLRAARWQLDPAVYADYRIHYDSFIDRTVVDAFAKSNPREREQVLDRARWQELEDLVIQQPFGLGAVMATYIKLQLMTRWYGLHRDKGAKQLASIVSQILPETAEVTR